MIGALAVESAYPVSTHGGIARRRSAVIITADSVATPRLSAAHGGAARQAAPIIGLNAVNGSSGIGFDLKFGLFGEKRRGRSNRLSLAVRHRRGANLCFLWRAPESMMVERPAEDPSHREWWGACER
ncbi:hypothetical protein DFH08DRAFT_803272 [Mycena albidolilacea]|uniref:Uncharacterized protein n=1 Tax=Mycena albidolilacea TaxID=1033008 RepID=A0AAD7ACK9_9AGAR|nr:hypothetical protein DFH08DRAFT_803272 [Mycena albidolilacea]